MSTSEALAMTQAAIKKLVADSVTTALEAQAANLANTDNTTRPREALVARQCSYKEFMSCQPINFKGTGAVGLIRWFERTESVFSRGNCTEDCKVKFAIRTLTKEALSWWNSFAQPIGTEEAYKITWVEFKKLLIKKYCPRTEVQKMEDEFYPLTVKGNDLKTYVRRFQELVTLCPTMVPYSEKMMEVFIGGLPRSIEGNVTASKPQTLEEAFNIAQRLIDQVGHLTKNCKNKGPATGSNLLPVTVTFHACGKKGHYANQCRKTTNNNAQGRAYMLRDRNAHQDPNVVTGMFLLNQHLAKVLFDSRADKSFVSISLASRLNIPPITIDTFYNSECDEEEQNILNFNDLFPFNVIYPDKLKMDTDNDNDKVDIEHSSEDLSVKPLPDMLELSVTRKSSTSQSTVKPSDHPRINTEREVCYAKSPSLIFWIRIVAISWTRNDSQGLHVDLAKIEARFIKDFSKIAKSLTELTQKNKKYIWGEDQESAFQLLKQKLCEAPILALPEGNDDFVVYCDASLKVWERFQTKALKEENIKAENLRGMDKAFEIRPDRTRCIKHQKWLPLFGNLRDLIMDESYKSKYSIHPASDKMYQDLKKLY
ncbi:reverse transcriptase domain-containing protein [Tanacetum coccineum]